MKKLALNVAALAVIGMGGAYLSGTQTAQAQDIGTQEATCEQDGKKLTGDKCYINDKGNCECI